MSVGYDHIDVKALKARNIQVGYTPDCLTEATADLTVLLALSVARRMKEVKKGIQCPTSCLTHTLSATFFDRESVPLRMER